MPKAVKNPTDFIPVIYQSVWEEGVVETNAEFNVKTGEIRNIEASDEGSDFESLVEENIVSHDGQYVAEVDTENNKFDYYASPTEFFGLGPKPKARKTTKSRKP